MSNKVRQVLLVEGHPDFLREEAEQTAYNLQYNGKKWYLGKIGKRVASVIRELNPDVEITETRVRYLRFITSIPDAPGIRLRRAGKNTTIEVSAQTEDELYKRIDAVKRFLEKNGLGVHERCRWVCTMDKKDAVVPKEKTKATLHGAGHIKTEPLITPEQKTPLEIKEAKKKKTKELREMVIRLGIQ